MENDEVFNNYLPLSDQMDDKWEMLNDMIPVDGFNKCCNNDIPSDGIKEEPNEIEGNVLQNNDYSTITLMGDKLITIELEEYIRFRTVQKEVELVTKENKMLLEEIQAQDKELSIYNNLVKEKEDQLRLLFTQKVQAKSESEVLEAKYQLLKQFYFNEKEKQKIPQQLEPKKKPVKPVKSIKQPKAFKQNKPVKPPKPAKSISKPIIKPQKIENKQTKRTTERRQLELEREERMRRIEQIVSEDLKKAKTPKPNEEIGGSWLTEGSLLEEDDNNNTNQENTTKQDQNKQKEKKDVKEAEDPSSVTEDDVTEEIKMEEEEEEEEWEVATTDFGTLPIPFIVNYNLILEILGQKFEREEDVVIRRGYPSILTSIVFKDFCKVIKLPNPDEMTKEEEKKKYLDSYVPFFEKCLTKLEEIREKKGYQRNLQITKHKKPFIQFIVVGKK